MKNIDIHQIDLLCQLIDTQNLGVAAERMQMSSSAASQSLARLGQAFPEDIYLRRGNAYVLSSYGERMIDGLRAMARRWREVEQAARRFDAQSSQVRFSVACVNHSARPDLARLHATFRSLAPRARLDLQVALHNGIEIQSLRAGKLDVLCASAAAPADARDLHHELLCTYALTHVLLNRCHPRITDAISLEQYLAEEHLVANYRNLDRFTRSPIDAALMERGLPPRRSTFVQSLWACLHMVARGDQLMTLSSEGARLLAHSLPSLRCLPLPQGLPTTQTQLHMIWHERTHWSAAHRWLRERVREECRLPADLPPSDAPVAHGVHA